MLWNARKNPSISCVEEGRVTFALGFSPTPEVLSLPVIHTQSAHTIPFLEIPFHQKKWKITALQTENLGELIEELTRLQQEDALPLLCLVQDHRKKEYIVMIDENARSSVSSLSFLLKRNLLKKKSWEKKRYVGVQIPQDNVENPSATLFIERVVKHIPAAS